MNDELTPRQHPGVSGAMLLRRYWSVGLVVFVGILFAVLGNGKPESPKPATLPEGWHVASEPGVVLAITFFRDAVWAGTKTGLHRLDPATGGYLGHVDAGPQVVHVRALQAETSDTLWIGHVDGLTRYGTAPVTFTTADGLPDNRVNALAMDRNGRLWIGTANGLASVRDGKVVPAPETSRLASPIVNAIVEDREGRVWIGSTSTPTGGVTLLDPAGTQIFTPERGLTHPYTNQLLVDRRGDVWAATGQLEEGGACRFRSDAGKWGVSGTISRSDGLPGAKVRSMFQDSDGDFWFGFENDGLALLTPRGIVVFTEADGLPHKEITCIVGGLHGEVWLGTLAGVLRISPEAVKRMKLEPPKGGQAVGRALLTRANHSDPSFGLRHSSSAPWAVAALTSGWRLPNPAKRLEA